MTRLAAEDRRRLHEGRLDAAALPTPAALTDAPALQAALQHQLDAYRSSYDALFAAAVHNLQESGETHATRTALEEPLTRTRALWSFAMGKATDALLNVDPEAPAKPTEVERRQRLLARAFPLPASNLVSLAFADVVTQLHSTVATLSAEPECAALHLHERLGTLATELQQAVDAWLREGREDLEATQRLRQARIAFDRAQASYADLLRSVLRTSDRLAELGRYFRAEDAAYKARRSTRLPIEQEPDFNPVDPVTPPVE